MHCFPGLDKNALYNNFCRIHSTFNKIKYDLLASDDAKRRLTDADIFYHKILFNRIETFHLTTVWFYTFSLLSLAVFSASSSSFFAASKASETTFSVTHTNTHHVKYVYTIYTYNTHTHLYIYICLCVCLHI